MERIISATEARINFGRVMRTAIENGPVIVERGGRPQVVIISKRTYDEICSGASVPDWRTLVRQGQENIQADLKGRSLPPPEDVLRNLREERDDSPNLY